MASWYYQSCDDCCSNLIPLIAQVESNQQVLNSNVAGLSGNLQTETANRIASDCNLNALVNAEAFARSNAVTALRSDLLSQMQTETTSRSNADTALFTQLQAEATARGNADNMLRNDLNAEIATRESVDTNFTVSLAGLTTGLGTLQGQLVITNTGLAATQATLAATAATVTGLGVAAGVQGNTISSLQGDVQSLRSQVNLQGTFTDSNTSNIGFLLGRTDAQQNNIGTIFTLLGTGSNLQFASATTNGILGSNDFSRFDSASNSLVSLQSSLGSAAFCNANEFAPASNFTFAGPSNSGFLLQSDWSRFNQGSNWSNITERPVVLSGVASNDLTVFNSVTAPISTVDISVVTSQVITPTILATSQARIGPDLGVTPFALEVNNTGRIPLLTSSNVTASNLIVDGTVTFSGLPTSSNAVNLAVDSQGILTKSPITSSGIITQSKVTTPIGTGIAGSVVSLGGLQFRYSANAVGGNIDVLSSTSLTRTIFFSARSLNASGAVYSQTRFNNQNVNANTGLWTTLAIGTLPVNCSCVYEVLEYSTNQWYSGFLLVTATTVFHRLWAY